MPPPLLNTNKPFPVAVYVDESGRFCPREDEHPIIVMLATPLTEEADTAVADLVGRWRTEYSDERNRIKGRNVPVEAKRELSQLIREMGWYVAWQGVDVEQDFSVDVDDMKEATLGGY